MNTRRLLLGLCGVMGVSVGCPVGPGGGSTGSTPAPTPGPATRARTAPPRGTAARPAPIPAKLRPRAPLALAMVEPGAPRTAVVRYPAKETVAPKASAPIALTDSTGQGLRLVTLKARSVVQGPLAFTELHLVFRNPRPRQIEGRFSITLPPGAAVSRLAMRQERGWQEAEVVERQQARRVYEDFLHRRIDPALLEKKAGNAFRARIFPIPAKGLKEIKISYSQALRHSKAPFRLHLRGLPVVDELDLHALVADGPATDGRRPLLRTVRLRKRNHKPTGDFEIHPRTRWPIAGLRHGRLALARVTPKLSTTKVPLAGLLILVDTSASRAAGFARQAQAVGQLIQQVKRVYGGAARLQVAAFDQTVRRLYVGNVARAARVSRQIRAQQALGASDLGRALAWARKQRGYDRVLVITDGVVTAGERDVARLRGLVSALQPAVKRLDVLLVGGIRDEALAKQLVLDTQLAAGRVLGGEGNPASWIRRLSRTTAPRITVSVPGAKWVWPSALHGVQAGDEILVYAGLARPGAGSLSVQLGGGLDQRLTAPLLPTPGPLLQRAAAAAHIAHLSRLRGSLAPSRAARRKALTREIVRISTAHRVLCEETALLVLETEQDYRRFKIDRRALVDILTVGARGIALLRRGGPVLARGPRPAPRRAAATRRTNRRTVDPTRPPPSPPASAAPARRAKAAPRRPQAPVRGGGRGSASWGGFGRGGGGSRGGGGYGLRGGVSRRTRSPRVYMSRASSSGGMDASTIRRVIRRHYSELKYCYTSNGIPSNPNLRGMIRVKFVIAATGLVAQAVVVRTTLNHTATEKCVLAAIKRWRFPKPEGAMPMVTIPLHFRPRGDILTGIGGRRTRRVGVPPIPKRKALAAYSGRMLAFQKLHRKRRKGAALALAKRWRRERPGDVMALVALGEAHRALGRRKQAARVYGSIIDLFPSRADLRRFAGQRLEALGRVGLTLAVDTYREAVAQRPDHPSSHRMLAYALVQARQPAQAFAALEAGLKRSYPSGRFDEIKRILGEDLSIVAAVWVRRAPAKRAEIVRRLAKHERKIATKPSLRFVLTWETDANDVDFHIYDRKRNHANFSDTELESGGELYADVTTGYGPECFAIPGKPKGYPYHVQLHYYSRGPMGYGMGKLDILRHDGRGGVVLRTRPFLVMKDGAWVDLGKIYRF